MTEFKDFLLRVIDALNASHLQYVIVGGVAAILRGRLRTTQDLDLIISNDQKKFTQFLNLIKTMDFEVLDEQVKFRLAEGFNISISDKKSFLRFDLKVAKTRDDIEALKNTTQEEYEGKSVIVATIDQILYGKVLYLGEIEDLSETELLEYNDVLDFIAIYQAHQTDIDLTWLKNKVKGKGLGRTLSRLLSLAKNYDTVMKLARTQKQQQSKIDNWTEKKT